MKLARLSTLGAHARSSRLAAPATLSASCKRHFLNPAKPADPEQDPDMGVYMAQARERLASHPAKIIYDPLGPMPDHLLRLALAPHIPPEMRSDFSSATEVDKNQLIVPNLLGRKARRLTPGNHLVYFPPQCTADTLLPDGTDPDHCPGAPFTRRMWAGGEIRWGRAAEKAGRTRFWKGAWFILNGQQGGWCRETVGQPVLKGVKGAEKIFVEVTRLYGPGRVAPSTEEQAEREAAITETRTLVFMRDLVSKRGDAGVNEGDAQTAVRVDGKEEGEGSPKSRIVKAPYTADFSFTLTPDARLLFHFSALSYNAHAIHLDPQYAREAEGHRGLLVHGPLSLVLMLNALKHFAKTSADRTERDAVPEELMGSAEAAPDELAKSESHAQVRQPATDGQQVKTYISSITYRNLAPLYASEKMRVCVARASQGRYGATNTTLEKVHVWIEGPDGGLAVKGTAEIMRVWSPKERKERQDTK